MNEGEGEMPRERDVPMRPARKRRTRDAAPAPDAEPVLHPAGEHDGGNDTLQETEEAAPDAEGQLTVDIYDDGPVIVIQSTVAGVKPEDIDISLQEDTLTIRGSRRRSHEVSEESFYYKELYWGTFSRSIILPEEVDFSKAEATMRHGLLTIRLPKKDRGEKKIRVRSGE